MAGGKKLWKLLLKILGSLLSLALLASVAVSLILARPEPPPAETPEVTVSPDAVPVMEIKNEPDLYRLVAAFPVPVMSFMSGSGMTFVSASTSNTAHAGRLVRSAALFWQTEAGIPLTLQSICPADTLDLLEKGYHFSAVAGPVLFGSPAVRMEKDGIIRIHSATDQALYVLTLPDSLGGQVSPLCRSLQLFTVHSEE